MAFLPLVGSGREVDDGPMTENHALPLTHVLIFDGFDDLDAVAPLEILAAAGCPVHVVRPPSHPVAVHSAHGLAIDVVTSLSSEAELVVVPGGGWLDGSAEGVRAQCGRELPEVLADLHRAGAVLASVCTGAMLLAAAGLMAGRPAVTNRMALDDLAAAGADVRRDARVVDAGSIVTGGGPAAGIDVAIRLVERFAGVPAAQRAARRLEHEPAGPLLVTVGVD
jgi:putative intracellular protease/amidase